MALAVLADELSASFVSHKAGAHVATGFTAPGGAKLILAAPHTYMNLSGKPTAALMKFFSLEPDRLIVLHDELDIDFDDVRVKFGGGHGGHNGLRDIIAALGTNEIARVRIGFVRPPGREDSADYVLTAFSRAQRDALPNILVDAADATRLIATDGVLAAQQKFNTKA
jgi:PTH1 family peptidyl-tRNA hydrolase